MDGRTEEPKTETSPKHATKRVVVRGNPVFFPGLNGVRFLAAFSVLLYHIEVFKHFSRLPNWYAFPLWKNLGPYGVVCFFTLSGFLITYLLLEEKEQMGTVRLRKFYIRRMLRIWPLYYLIIALGFTCAYLFADTLGFRRAPLEPLGTQVGLFALMLPNLAWQMYGVIPFVGPLWSVGVEEQFYATWPWLFKMGRKQTLFAILAILLGFIAARFLVSWLTENHASHSELNLNWRVAIGFFATLKLECMIVGGLMAFVIQRKSARMIPLLHSLPIQAAALLFIPLALWHELELGPFSNTVWGIAFGIFILNVATNPKALVRLRHPALDYLGRISFGLYVYHSFAIAGCLLVLRTAYPSGGVTFNVLLYGLSTLITVGMAALSFRLYEQPFLSQKKKWTVIENHSEDKRKLRPA